MLGRLVVPVFLLVTFHATPSWAQLKTVEFQFEDVGGISLSVPAGWNHQLMEGPRGAHGELAPADGTAFRAMVGPPSGAPGWPPPASVTEIMAQVTEMIRLEKLEVEPKPLGADSPDGYYVNMGIVTFGMRRLDSMTIAFQFEGDVSEDDAIAVMNSAAQIQ
jgi:hypothetical protein